MAVKPDEGKPGRPPTDSSLESLPPLELEDPDSWLLSSDTEDEDAPSIQPRAPAKPLPGAFTTSPKEYEIDLSRRRPGGLESRAPAGSDSSRAVAPPTRSVSQDRTKKDDEAVLGHSFPSVSGSGRREDSRGPTSGRSVPSWSADIVPAPGKPVGDPEFPGSSPAGERGDEIHLRLMGSSAASGFYEEPAASGPARLGGRPTETPIQRLDTPRSPGASPSPSQPSMKVQTPPIPGTATSAHDPRFTPEFIEEIRSMFSYLDRLLESLPDERIEEFARSPYFESYRKIFEILRLV